MESNIETANTQGVGVLGDDIVILMPVRRMSKTDALRHAAWLVALADMSDDNEEFKAVLQAVQNT